MKTWAVLPIFIQTGFSFRFEYYEIDNRIAISNNGIDLTDNEIESQDNSENLIDATGQTKEGENEWKMLKILTRIKRKAGFSITSKNLKQEVHLGKSGALKAQAMVNRGKGRTNVTSRQYLNPSG